MDRERLIEHLMPWGGLLAATVGWTLAHQLGSNSVFDDCRTGTPAFILIVNFAGLAVAALGGLWSWRVWRRSEAESEGRRFLGLLGVLAAALLGFTLLLQALAGLVLPRCLA